MRRRHIGALALAAAVVVAGWGRVGSGSVAAAAPAAAPAEQSLDVLPEQLVEPPPANETQRLLFESRRTSGFCTLLANLDGVKPPNPEDIGELVNFAQQYYQNTTFLEPRPTVPDPDRRGQRMSAPEALIQSVKVERAAMYAFLVRMQSARASYRDHALDAAGLGRRVRFGFMRLMSSGFSDADRALQDARMRYCR